MGYYSYFELSAKPFDSKTLVPMSRYEELDVEIAKMNVMEDHIYENEWSGYGKWYDCREDMLLLSTKFPEMLFTLHGDGDETGDLWYEYYNNGRLQRCPAEIVYPVYEEEKLKAYSGEMPERYSCQS